MRQKQFEVMENQKVNLQPFFYLTLLHIFRYRNLNYGFVFMYHPYLKMVVNDIIVAKYENLVSKMMELYSTDKKQECIAYPIRKA